MESVKDHIANATTIAGTGAVIMDFQAPLTIILIITGIILNIVRIYDVRMKK